MLQWKQARIRAEIARTQSAGLFKALPWPLETAVRAALEGEWQEHRRPLPLKKWERLFRWMHPDSREKMWAEFTCHNCGRRRRTEAIAAEAIATAGPQLDLICGLLGLNCGHPETMQIWPWELRRKSPPAQMEAAQPDDDLRGLQREK